MSSAGIAEIEMAAASAMLALSAALGGAGAAMEDMGGLAISAAAWMRERADGKQAQDELARWYEELVREVLDRHARIDALTASAQQLQRDRGVCVALAIPEPLCYQGQDPATLEAWCASTDIALTAAERTLSEAITQAVTAELMAASGLGAGSSVLVTTDMGSSVLVSDSAAAAVGDPRAELAAILTRVLSRLSPDVVPADLAAVRHAAARVAEAATMGEAASRLTDVRIRVQLANEKARGVREDTLHAARCLRGLAGYQAPGMDGLRAELARVVAGRCELDQRLGAEADAAVSRAQAERESRYLAATLAAALDGLGYQLGEEFETLTARDSDVLITRGDWPAHAVKVKLGENHELRFAMVRTRQPASRQDRLLDAEREQAWCESFEQVRAGMAERGVRSAVRWRLDPGTQQLPVADRRDLRQAASPRHRESPAREEDR
jgi:hypothetical protein